MYYDHLKNANKVTTSIFQIPKSQCKFKKIIFGFKVTSGCCCRTMGSYDQNTAGKINIEMMFLSKNIFNKVRECSVDTGLEDLVK